MCSHDRMNVQINHIHTHCHWFLLSLIYFSAVIILRTCAVYWVELCWPCTIVLGLFNIHTWEFHLLLIAATGSVPEQRVYWWIIAVSEQRLENISSAETKIHSSQWEQTHPCTEITGLTLKTKTNTNVCPMLWNVKSSVYLNTGL